MCSLLVKVKADQYACFNFRLKFKLTSAASLFLQYWQ